MAENYSIVTDINAGNSMAVLDQIISKVVQVESAIGKASGQKLQIDATGSTTVLSGLTGQLSGQKGNFANVGRELGQSFQMGMQQQFGMAGGVASSFASALGPIGIAAGVAGVALIGLGSASTQAAAAWEDMKTSIGRTTGLEGNNLEDLMNQLQDLRQEMGITSEAASSLVEQAGSIGVGQAKLSMGDVSGYKQEIVDFAKATATLQGAWGMSAEATSSGIGKMGSVTLGQWNNIRKARGEEEMSWADYAYKVGGQVDSLANSMGSSEEEIVTAMKNSSGAIAKWAPSEETYGKWQAMASFLIDTGATAGEAGTQIERVSQKMEQNGADVASLMGLDQASLNTKLKTDFMGTIQELGQTIAAMPESSRPDLFKMFGLEGADLVGKVVSDIQNNTGKLNDAFKYAANPTNVSEGYKNVADNASKAFDRIGQAFQVSLEKIGGQLLPIVTDIANGIANAWISANELGTQAFTAAQTRIANADKTINETGSIIEWGKALLGIGEITPAVEDATAKGASSGMAKGADAAKGAITESTKEAVTDAYEAVQKAASEFTKQNYSRYAAGMTYGSDYTYKGEDYVDPVTGKLVKKGDIIKGTGTWSSNVERDSFYKDKSLDSGKYNTFANGEIVWNLLKEAASGKSGVLKAVVSVDGKEYTREFSTMEDTAESATKKIKAEFKDIAYDVPKYFKTVGDDISDVLTNSLSDGVLSFTEKDELSNYLKSLESIEMTYPIQFKASHLDELKKDVEDAVKGTLITFDASKNNLTFSKFISENADMYNKIYQKTGIISYEKDEKLLQEALKAAPKEAQDLYAELQSAVSSGDFSQLQMIPDILAEIGDVAPELLVLTGTTNRLAAAQEEYMDGYAEAISKNSEAAKNGDRMNGFFLRSSQHMDTVNRGYIKMASAEYDHASAVGRARSGMEMLYSPMITVKEDLTKLNKPITDVATSGNALDAAFIDTTTYVNNANSALGSFASALGAATSAISANRYYAPSVMQEQKTAYTYQLPYRYAFEPLETELPFLSGIPKFATGAKVTSKTLGWIAEGGETEYIIPESQIKGLWPKSKVEYGSLAADMNLRYFLDYPEPKITAPTSYRWSHYPDAPQVQEYNTDAIQTAWLADEQLNSRDIYSSRIREAQLAAIGKSQVIPWFARGEIEQPKWWIDAATKLSPQYAANWAESKGGTVPKIASENESSTKTNAVQRAITVSDAWDQLYGKSFTEGCISTNKPDPALKFTPSASLVSEIGRTMGVDATAAWNRLYGNAFTEGCISTNKPDSLLKFTPSQRLLEETARANGSAWGSQFVSVSGKENALSIQVSGDDTSNEAVNYLSSIDQNIKSQASSMKAFFDTSYAFGSPKSGFPSLSGVESNASGALVGLSKEGYVVSYDPRTDTCEGLAFNAPDPSLKTTDKFYLGLTQNSPYRSTDKSPGYGWENVAQTDNENLQQLMKINEESYKESQKNSENTKDTAKNTAEMSKDMKASMSGMVYNSAGQLIQVGGGNGWGGTSIGGGGGWIGTWGTHYGLNGSVYYGSTSSGAYAASGGHTGWGGQASSMASSGHGSIGSVQWAEGGITDHPVFGVFGEAGREAFVPISDRAAGLRILPQVMRELGVRTFASGGIVGSGGLSAFVDAIGGTTIAPVYHINGSGLSEAQLSRVLEKHDKKLMSEMTKRSALARKRRG